MSIQEKIISGEGEFEGWIFQIFDGEELGADANDYVVVGSLDDDSLPKPFPQAVIKKSILDADYKEAIIRVQQAIAEQLDEEEFRNYETRVT